MAFVTELQSFESELIQRMRASLDNVRAAAGKRREFNRTLNELNALDQRDLDDLGISRENIREIAREAAYGK